MQKFYYCSNFYECYGRLTSNDNDIKKTSQRNEISYIGEELNTTAKTKKTEKRKMTRNFESKPSLEDLLDNYKPTFPVIDERKETWEFTGPPPKTKENLKIFPEEAWNPQNLCFAMPWSFFKVFCNACGTNILTGVGPTDYLLRRGCPRCMQKDVKVLGQLYTDPPRDAEEVKDAMRRTLIEFPNN